jgi:DME family drug/metabolite transporter
MRSVPVFQVLAAAVLWASAGVAGGLAQPRLAPALLAEARAVIGGAVLLAMVGARPALRALRAGDRREVIRAAGAMAIFQWSFFASVETLDPGLAVLLAAAVGPFAADAIHAARSGAPLPGRWALLLGVLLLAFGLHALEGRGAALGVAFGAASGASYAWYADAAGRLARRAESPAGGAAATVLALAGASLALLPAAAAAPWGPPTASRLAVAAYLGLAATALAYALFIRGLSSMSASAAMSLLLVQPVAAAALEAVVRHAPLRREFVADLILSAGCVALRRFAPSVRVPPRLSRRPGRSVEPNP